MMSIVLATHPTSNSELIKTLNPKQLNFLKQYTYRFDYNWRTQCTELRIRKTDFTEQELTRILFLFPQAQL